MKFTSYLGFILDLSLMLSIPISAVLLYFNYRSAQQKLDALHQKNQTITDSNFIIFTSNNKKELLRVTIDDILYLEGQENYVAVHYLHEKQPTKKLLRSTMQRMEENLNATPILRCHRSFFINSTKISKINRQSSQFTVSLKGVAQEIPVSEKFQNNIIDRYYI